MASVQAETTAAEATAAPAPLLRVRGLKTVFRQEHGEVNAVNGVNFDVRPGETVAIVGESGSGKSITAMSILRLIPSPPGEIVDGEIEFAGRDLLSLSEEEIRLVRGNEIAMIFQEPMSSLNPVLTIGQQLAEPLIVHKRVQGKKAIRERCLELLRQVRIPDPERRLDCYPHEFSGGMRQRVMIAIALACNPALLIADEPTTALDVTIQAQVMQFMKELQQNTNTSIILITHDLGVVVDLCDRVIVMYAGQIVETGTKWEIFKNPQHPYTKGLLKSLPRLDQPKDEPLIPIYGTPPDMIQPPQGCGFCSRCEAAMRICERQDPEWTAISETQSVRCWLQSAGEKAAAVVGGKEADA